MTKHPALRVRFYGDLWPSVKTRIRDFFVQASQGFPAVGFDFEVSGAYVRGKAMFHSDLDVHLAAFTEADRVALVDYIRNNPRGILLLRDRLNAIYETYGIRVDLFTRVLPTFADHPHKRCYRILAGTWHGLNTLGSDKRWDWNKTTNEWFMKPEKKVGRVGISSPIYITLDTGEKVETGEYAFGVDPFESELPLWRRRYGNKLIELTDSPDTKWMYGV